MSRIPRRRRNFLAPAAPPGPEKISVEARLQPVQRLRQGVGLAAAEAEPEPAFPGLAEGAARRQPDAGRFDQLMREVRRLSVMPSTAKKA